MTDSIISAGILVLIIVPGIVTALIVCPDGWFGKSCQFKCHCAGLSCDSTGECQSGSGCDTGWFGPACQYVDLTSIGTVTTETNQGFKDDVTVGQLCLGGSNIWSVTVTLNRAYHLTWMRFIFSDPGFLKNITATFNKNLTSVTCNNQKTVTVNSKTLDIHCTTGVAADKVILTGEGIKFLCSLYISGGRNIALKQNATQSSLYQFHTADKAVDGDTSGTFRFCSCMSRELNPSWILTFSRSHQIHGFALYNRAENQERLQRFIINSYDDSRNTPYRYPDNSIRAEGVYKIIPESILESVFWVNVSSKVEYFTICETEIYGDVNCPGGMYGRNCENICKCAVMDEACIISTGGCPSGCSAGFHGDGCNTACLNNFYGIDCKYACSQNCSGNLCNSVTGACFGCVAGMQGEFCNEACSPGHYGEGCAQICSQNCSGDGSCDGLTGACSHCRAGYKGDTCSKKCQTSYYGERCLFICSTNCTNQTCDYASGHCLSCIPGTSGTFCEKDYVTQSESDDNTALIYGLVAGLIVLVIAIVAVALVWRRNRKLQTNSRHQEQIKDDEDQISAPDNIKATRGESIKDVQEPDNMDSVLYYNMCQTQISTAIRVKDLHTFLVSHKFEYFKSQFEKIPNIHPEATSRIAHSEENKTKNRYKNICAYDHSRVHLLINAEKNEGDYINASLVEGYKNKERFIAAQGPNSAIINDFVRMMWEQKVDKVVMLTHLVEEGKAKCERYWPEDNKTSFGEIQVKLATTQVFADYTIRKLELKKHGAPGHNLTHFHFTSWPDKGVPVTPWSLVDFEQRVFACPTTKPILVHCSAGVGRTGTFIALCNVVRQALDTGYIDFYNTVVNLRKDRMFMIQTTAQYYFLHKAAEMSLLCFNTTVLAQDITDKINYLQTREFEVTNMENEFNSICDVCAEDIEDKGADLSDDTNNTVYANSLAFNNKLKNRFSNILPNDLYRLHLYEVENSDVGDYINAVLVPSFTKSNHQILTQLPLPSTVTDFWQLVTQYEVSLIVAFEVDLKAKDETIGDYLPSKENEDFKCGSFIIETVSSTSGQFWLQQALTISNSAKDRNLEKSCLLKSEEHKVMHLRCTSVELDSRKLLALADKIRSLSSLDKGRTLFMCRDGATYSGLVYVVTLLLERMDNDHQLTIPLVVGAVKAVRPQVVPTVEQYRALYEVLSCYHESTNVYSNIRNSSLKLTTSPKLLIKSETRNSQATSESNTDISSNDHGVYANIIK